MKAAIFDEFGDPAEVLSAAETEMPEPGADEVRVRTGLAVIHNHDLSLVSGNYGYQPELPAIGGSEAMGVIDKVGEGVGNLKPGMRVATGFTSGTWAEYFTVKADYVVPLPDTVADEAAAQMLAMPLSALFAIETLGAKKGDWILQSGGTGAVAKVVAQLGKAWGIGVVNLVRREHAVAELEELGIGNAVVTASEDWPDRVAEIVDGEPITGIIDSVGGDLAGQMLHLMANNGLFLSFGAMSGEALQLSPRDLIMKQAEVKGFWLGKMLETMPIEKLRQSIGALVELLSEGSVTLQTGNIYSLDRIGEAVKAAREKARGGKILIRP
ncbi:alcohol dehydrogenase [Altericroceibacterium spongiae]|uniref:Alcohol dehydrogenase n=1 Tax=Altericroceibacterium spongiae TaxID=2320269 RepID=A0A420EPF7_9SPHN|nr:zinc-binding dehydrogenase [Altericroceibacterium spongiae]RKF22563.1 alcohol dehydrogenase [Altericroceibacterium spongiae]